MHEIGIYPLKDPDQDDILSLTNRLIKFLNLIRSEVQYESAVTKVRTFVTIWSNRWLNCGLGWLETISQDRCIRTAAFDAIWQAKEARSNDRKISIILRTNEVRNILSLFTDHKVVLRLSRWLLKDRNLLEHTSRNGISTRNRSSNKTTITSKKFQAQGPQRLPEG